MKKARLFSLFVLIIIFALLMLAGCEKNENISSVSLKGYDPEGVIEMPFGEFDYESYKLTVSYDSGRSEEVDLNKEMISDEDQFKFYQEGEHEITVTYNGLKCTFKIFVKRSTFGTLSFPESNVFVYDGKAHSVDVLGDIPANAIITYPEGNSFINAGTYDVTAIVSCEGYVTERLSTTVKIERAKYDMSGVKLESKEFDYDGQLHTIEISGELPAGVSSPIYTINGNTLPGVSDAGEYKVIATFLNSDPNYETIPDMEATLKINKAEYVVNGVDLVFKTDDGKVINGNEKVYDGSHVVFELSDSSKISKKASVSFAVYDASGILVSNSNINTKMINAGVYTVKAEFTLSDNKNYTSVAPIVRTFEITKAEYPTVNVEFESDHIVYDGTAHSIKITEPVPAGLTVSYEYYLSDTLITDADGNPVQSVTDAGRYTVNAIFAHNDINYKAIEPIFATLEIEQAQINTMQIMFDYNGDLVEDGTPKYVKPVKELPEYIEVSYEYYRNGELLENDDGTPVTSVVEAGEYTVIIIFNVNKNYAPLDNKTLNFTIAERNN